MRVVYPSFAPNKSFDGVSIHLVYAEKIEDSMEAEVEAAPQKKQRRGKKPGVALKGKAAMKLFEAHGLGTAKQCFH